MKGYIKQVEGDGVGPNGIMTKVDRIIMAIRYTLRTKLMKSDQVHEVLERLSAWKKVFSKQKFSSSVERAITDKREEDPERNSAVQAFFSCRPLQQYMADLGDRMDELEQTEITHMATYLFCSLVYRNWQRPGPAIALTIAEATRDCAVGRADGKLVLNSRTHKTSASYGPASLVLEGSDVDLFKKFLTVTRPGVTTSSTTDSVLVTGRGQPLTSYRDHVNALCRKFHLGPMPTPTQMRKVGASSAVQQNVGQSAMEEISKHMTHSSAVSEKYYRDLHRADKAVAVYECMKSISSGKVKLAVIFFYNSHCPLCCLRNKC